MMKGFGAISTLALVWLTRGFRSLIFLLQAISQCSHRVGGIQSPSMGRFTTT